MSEYTTEQLVFFRDSPTLREAFAKFHEENPQVYEMFKKFANQAIEAGRDRFSVAMIWERMRWYTMVETTGEPFKLNNNHKAYYARLFMDDFSEHAGLFRTRRLTSEGE